MKVLGVFEEDVILCLPFITASLWALGGSGKKAFRRFGVPLILCLFAYGYGLKSLNLAIYALLTFGLIGFGPGYGDDYFKRLKSLYWPYVFILGSLYGLCQIALVMRFGNFLSLLVISGVCGVVFGVGMLVSKSKFLPWKIAECLTGLAVGSAAAVVIYNFLQSSN